MNWTKDVDIEKTVLIDYITISMDFFKVIESSPRFYEIEEYDLFNEFLGIIGFKGDAKSLQKDYALHGFTEGYRIGEHIRLMYGGASTKNTNGDYPVLLELTGSACREFENYMNGSWLELFEFLFNQDETMFRITRFDLAIDDYTGKEITFNELEKSFFKKNFSTSSRKYSYHNSGGILSDDLSDSAKTLYIGVRGGNHLVIYDKFQELKINNKMSSIKSDYHFRYEMRFVNEKAKEVVRNYYISNITNDSTEFMNYTASLLLQFVEFKDPTDKKKKVRSRRIDPRWHNFLNKVAKSEITVKAPEEVTLEEKDIWMQGSMLTTMLEQFSTKGIPGGLSFLLGLASEAIDDDLKESKIVRINKARLNKGETELTRDDFNELKRTLDNLKEMYEPEKKEVTTYEEVVSLVSNDPLKDLKLTLTELNEIIKNYSYYDDAHFDYISINGEIYQFRVSKGTTKFDSIKKIVYFNELYVNNKINIKNEIIKQIMFEQKLKQQQ